MRSVTVVGASLAGVRAAETLRQSGFEGAITVVGEERHAPYDRPPLSKQVLAGDWQPERTALPAATNLDVQWQLGRRATALDLTTRTITLDSAEHQPFDGLVIATGAAPRQLPGVAADTTGIHVLRTIDQCVALRDDLDKATSVVVVGAGFIGAEVAAISRGRGLDVTILEALPVPLGRALGPQVGSVCGELHRDHGVDLRLGAGVEGFDVDGAGQVQAVRLAGGSRVDADVVVVGIGVSPNTGWLDGSGLTLDDGVLCDATGLAAPGVVAAGDVARWPNLAFGGEVMRVEHWDNALAQGAHAAQRLLSDAARESSSAPKPFMPVPWCWSDQYDRKIQLVGRCHPDDEVRLVDGSFAERRFVALYGRKGQVTAAVGFNRPAVIMRFRRLIADGLAWDDPLAEPTDGP